jgi:hypothetical protein
MKESTVDQIAKEVQVAMDKIAEKHGVTFKRGNIRWNDNGFKFTGIEFNEISENGFNAQDESDFKAYSMLYGFTDDAFNTNFTHNGETMKIIGYNRRARKDKFKLLSENGKGYKCSLDFLKNAAPKFFV